MFTPEGAVKARLGPRRLAHYHPIRCLEQKSFLDHSICAPCPDFGNSP